MAVKEELEKRINLLYTIIFVVIILGGIGYFYTTSDRALSHNEVKQILNKNPDQDAFIVEHPNSVEIIHRSDRCEYQLTRIKKDEIIVKCGNRIGIEFQNYLEYYRTYGEPDQWVRNSRKTRSIDITVAQVGDSFEVIRNTEYYKKRSGTSGSVKDIFKVTKNNVKIAAEVDSEIQQDMRLTYQVDKQGYGIFDFPDLLYNSYVGKEDNKYYYGNVRGDFKVDPQIILASPIPDLVNVTGGDTVHFEWFVDAPFIASTKKAAIANSSLQVLFNTTGFSTTYTNTSTIGSGNGTVSTDVVLPSWSAGTSCSPYSWRTYTCDNRSLPNHRNCKYSETKRIILAPKGAVPGEEGIGQFGFEVYNLNPPAGTKYKDGDTVTVSFTGQIQPPLALTYVYVEAMVNTTGWSRVATVNTTGVRNDNVTEQHYVNYSFSWALPANSSALITTRTYPYLFRAVACSNTTVLDANNCTYSEHKYIYPVEAMYVSTPLISTSGATNRSDQNVTCTAGSVTGFTPTYYYYRLHLNDTFLKIQTSNTTSTSWTFGYTNYRKDSNATCSFLATDANQVVNSSWSTNSSTLVFNNGRTVGYNITAPETGLIKLLNATTANILINFSLGTDVDGDTLYGNLTFYTPGGSKSPITNSTWGLNSTYTDCTEVLKGANRSCATAHNWTGITPGITGEYYLELKICDVENMTADSTKRLGQCVTETTVYTIGIFNYKVRWGTSYQDFILDPVISTNMIPYGQTNWTGIFQVYLDGTSVTASSSNLSMNLNDTASASTLTDLWCGPRPPVPASTFKATTHASNITNDDVANDTAVLSVIPAHTWTDIYCLADKRTGWTAQNWYFGFLMDSYRGD